MDEKKGTLLNISLTAYEWHGLLDELQRLLQIVNRDNNNVKVLYQKIASQLNDGREVKVIEK